MESHRHRRIRPAAVGDGRIHRQTHRVESVLDAEVEREGVALRAWEAQRECNRRLGSEHRDPIHLPHEPVNRVRAVLVRDRELVVYVIPAIPAARDASGKRDQDVALPALLVGGTPVAGHHRLARVRQAAQAGPVRRNDGSPRASLQLDFGVVSHMADNSATGARQRRRTRPARQFAATVAERRGMRHHIPVRTRTARIRAAGIRPASYR